MRTVGPCLASLSAPYHPIDIAVPALIGIGLKMRIEAGSKESAIEGSNARNGDSAPRKCRSRGDTR